MSCGNKLANACPQCATELPAGAKFCFNCGHAMGAAPPAAAEPAPAAPNPLDNLTRYVPPELLAKLTSAKQAGGMEGERRNVTMLFCDVKGSTAAAEKLDPEEWADIMNGAFEHLIAPVYRYEGTLARLMGDAILAFFGAPLTHEDDPERAVLAALDILEEIGPYRARIRREWGIDFDVRVGINTGLVVVGAMGSDLRVEYTVMGDAVNVAARMEQTAAPGTIQVADDTWRLIDKIFVGEPLGGVAVKGKSEPVRTWQITGRRERPRTLRGIEGLHAPLIGRDAELVALREAFESIRRGRGRIQSVMAEAGLGKSRLVTELKERLEAEGTLSEVGWFEGRSLSWQNATPFAPIRGILEEVLALRGGESDAARWSRIEHACRDLVPARVDQIAPFLGSLLEIEMPVGAATRVRYLKPDVLQLEVFRAFTEVIEARAARQPVVLVFEDLHWADSASIQLVKDLMAVTDRAMLMLLLVFRPRRNEPSWGVHEEAGREHGHRYHAIQLSPLPPDDSRTLVSHLLTVDDLPARVRELILAKAEGNPFYVEEVIRSLLDQGLIIQRDGHWHATREIANVKVPDTLAAVVNTRLDRLGERERRVVQAASIIGREFRYPELAAILPDLQGIDDALRTLERRSLLREVARVPQRQFRFKHALVVESTYATLLLKRRRQLHGDFAIFLEKTQPERVQDIASHFQSARMNDRAIPWLIEVGHRAMQAHANAEAVKAYDTAVELLGDDGDEALLRPALEGLGLASQAMFDFDGAADAFRKLTSVGRKRQNASMQISGLNKTAFVEGLFFGDQESAIQHVAESEALAKDQGEDNGLIECSMTRCYIHTGYGDFTQVEHYMNQVVEVGDRVGAVDEPLFGLTHLANTLASTTRWDESLEVGKTALDRARGHANLKYQAELLTFSIPTAHMGRGEFPEAIEALEQGLEIATRINDHSSIAFATATQGKIALAQGAFEQALSLSRRTRDATDATGVPYLRSLGSCVLGSCYVEVGGPMLERAQMHHVQSMEMLEMPTGVVMATWVLAEVAHCAFESGDVDGAEALFDRALNTKCMPMFLMRPDALAGACRAAIAQGDIDRADRLCTELHEFVNSRNMNQARPLLPMSRGRVEAARGNHEQAVAAFQECVDMVQSMGMKKRVLDAQSLMARSLDALGRAEDAASLRAKAQNTLDDIAANIQDAPLRASFVQGATQSLNAGA